MLFVLTIAVVLSGGCTNAADFMQDEDKQPRLEVFAYSSGGGLLSSPVTGYCLYTLVDGELMICDVPTGLIRFDIYVESYDVNQRFDVDVIFPHDDIEYLSHYDPGLYPTVVKWPQAANTLPIAWETVPKTYISDGGRGPGGYFTLTVAFWAPMGGQMGWAPKHENVPFPEGSFFIWDGDDPDFVQPEITFVVTDDHGRKAVRKVKPWVNIYELCIPCPGI
jgi:hypothetical protein